MNVPKITLTAVVAILLILAAPAQAWQNESLKATETVQRWNTPQRYGHSQVVQAHIMYRGERVEYESKTQTCSADIRARDLLVNVRVCGSGRVPIRVRYVSFDGPRKFSFRYRLKR